MPKIVIAFIIFFALGLIITGITFLGPKGNTNSGDNFSEEGASIFVSDDGGKTWKGVSGTSEIYALSMERALDSQSTLYIGTEAHGLLELNTKSMGVSRFFEKEGILGKSAQVLDILSDVDGKTYAATFEDNTARVIRVEKNNAKIVHQLALEGYGIFGLIRDGNNLFAAAGDGDFLRSGTEGETWQIVSRTADGIIHLTAHPFISGSFWAIGNKGTFYTTVSSGTLWKDLGRVRLENVSNVGKIYDMKFHKQRGALIVGTDYGIIESTDSGTSWKDFKSPIPPGSIPISTVEVHPQFAEVFWFTARNVVYKTLDGGITWSASVLPKEGTIQLLFADEVNPDRLYAGFSK